jgi:hypothetical protein
LGYAAVFDWGLDDRNRVVLKEIMDKDFSEMILLTRFMNGFLEVGIKTKHLVSKTESSSFKGF